MFLMSAKKCVVLTLLTVVALFSPWCVYAGVAIGDSAPEFELPGLDGKMVSVSQVIHGDKPVVLSFFATWCNSCLEEIRDLSEMVKNSNARVYLVGVDAEKRKLEHFVEKHKISFPVLWDPKAAITGKRYDLLRGAFLVVPKTFVISPAGNIEYLAESYDAVRKQALEDTLTRLNGERWEKTSEMAVFFTGSANGYLESCNCYRHPYGGFVKSASLFKQQAAIYSNHVLVDSGDFLPYGVTEAQAQPIFRALAVSGYDAVAIGDQDLFYKGFASDAAKNGIPIISSNLNYDGGVIGTIDKTVTAGNMKVRILSYTSPEIFSLYPEDFSSRLKFKELKETLKAEKNADLLILLSHASLDENKKIAAAIGQIDLIVSGHSQELLKSPIKWGNALIVQSGGNLQNLGRIVLRFDGKKKIVWHSYNIFPLTKELPDSPEVKAIIRETPGQGK